MKKVFVSYKYWDDKVYQYEGMDKIANPGLLSGFVGKDTYRVTPRSYLNKLSNILKECAVQKWEKDDEDLSNFKESTIASKLRDKIYDSSITIVLVSPGMKDCSEPEIEQWIPWEISYSVSKHSRNGRTSKTNGVVVVVLPDANNSYDYCLEKLPCSTILKFSDPFCFDIIAKNFFNANEPDKYHCNTCNGTHYRGSDNHYFVYARWNEFCANPQQYIELAEQHSEKTSEYNIKKMV